MKNNIFFMKSPKKGNLYEYSYILGVKMMNLGQKPEIFENR
jgi:hypothetical protein